MGRDPLDGNITIPASLHKCLYVGGDPVDGFDPTGQDDEEVIPLWRKAVAVATILALVSNEIAEMIDCVDEAIGSLRAESPGNTVSASTEGCHIQFHQRNGRATGRKESRSPLLPKKMGTLARKRRSMENISGTRNVLKTRWARLLAATAIVGLCALFLAWKIRSGEEMRAAKLSEAIARVRESAGQGIPDAEFELALLYDKGKGVTQNEGEAAHWYQKAAEQGFAPAQSSLGSMYLLGQGLPQDKALAFHWNQEAAEQGDMKGEASLGYFYFYGVGVPQDYTQSAMWYSKAANSGEVSAQSALGYMYLHGHGVAQNRTEAIAWYRKAAGQGDSDAARSLQMLGEAPFRRTRTQWFELVTAAIALPAGFYCLFAVMLRGGRKGRGARHS